MILSSTLSSSVVGSLNTKYIERLDHLRFFAALLILLFHTQLMVGTVSVKHDHWQIPLINQGHLAVQLFMVISGMILTIITYDKIIDATKFYWNRVLRIYPLFIFILALGYFATPDQRPAEAIVKFLTAISPISNMARLEYGEFGGQLWSIAIELQFYLLFPLLLLLLRQYHMKYHLALIGFLIVIRTAIFYLHGTVHHLSYFSLFGSLDLFLIGQLIGTLYCRGELNFRNPFWLCASFLTLNGIVVAAFAHSSFFHVQPLAYTGHMVGSQNTHWLWIVWPDITGLIFAVLIPSYLQCAIRIPLSSLLARLGQYSYSMYLWHIMAINIILKLGFQWLTPYQVGFLVTLPLTLLFSAASYYLIEKPFLSMRVVYIKALPDYQSSEKGFPPAATEISFTRSL